MQGQDQRLKMNDEYDEGESPQYMIYQSKVSFSHNICYNGFNKNT